MRVKGEDEGILTQAVRLLEYGVSTAAAAAAAAQKSPVGAAPAGGKAVASRPRSPSGSSVAGSSSARTTSEGLDGKPLPEGIKRIVGTSVATEPVKGYESGFKVLKIPSKPRAAW